MGPDRPARLMPLPGLTLALLLRLPLDPAAGLAPGLADAHTLAPARLAREPSDPASSAEIAPAEGEAPLGWFELVTGGAEPDAALPMVVVLHGRAQSPRRLARTLRDLARPCRLVFLEGPVQVRGGPAWMTARLRQMPDGERAAQLAARAAEVAETIELVAQLRPTLGKPSISGYSQGAAVALTVAFEHPEAVDEVLAVATWVEPTLRDSERLPRARLRLVHGLRDRQIPLAPARALSRRIVSRGGRADWHPVARSGHRFDPALRRELRRELDHMLADAGHMPQRSASAR